MSETKAEKAIRFLAERRLTVETVRNDGLIVASCRGDSGEVHKLGYRPDHRRWGCTCKASAEFGRLCSHLLALQHVTTINGGTR